MDDIDDEKQREYDAIAHRRQTAAMIILYILAAILLAAAVIMAYVELHYIEYGRGLAFTWGY